MADTTTLFTLPTASGKSYIIGIAASAFMRADSVVIAVPDELLNQMKIMIDPLCPANVIIVAHQDLYKRNFVCDILFIDECDRFFNEMALYAKSETKLCGVFSIRDPYNREEGDDVILARRTIVGFSATGDDMLLRLVRNTFDKDAVLVRLPSEYEYMTGQENIDPVFKGVDDTYVATLEQTDKLALLMPVIVFLDDDKIENFKKHFIEKGYKMYKEEHVPHLHTMSAGVLPLLKSRARGLNTKFKVAAFVVIQCALTNEAEYI